MLSDEELDKYVGEAVRELVIINYEDQMLHFLKSRQEKYPSEKNDKDWLDFTNYVCQRRKSI